MFDNMENLTLVSSYNGISKPYNKVQSRKTNAFIFRTNGAGEFAFGNETITVHKGEMIFIPQGSSYEFRVVSEEECKYTSIAFYADLTDAKPTLYSIGDFPDTDYIINHFSNLWKIGSQADKYKCISMFYSLLAYISNTEHQTYAEKSKFNIIEPAVSYLKSNIFNSKLKADSLHLLCGISDTYFRKLFVSKFGITPQQYITAKRLSQAKSLIDSASFETISDIAFSVGYKDPLYFSRVFKKKYGVSPSFAKD